MKSPGISIWILMVVCFCNCSRGDLEVTPKDGEDSIASQLEVPSGFNFETSKNYSLELLFVSNNSATQGVVFELFDVNLDKLEENEEITSVANLYKGVSDQEGRSIVNLRLPASTEVIYLKPNYFGFSELIEIELNQSTIEVEIGGERENTTTEKATFDINSILSNTYEYIHEVDFRGTPLNMSFDEFDDYFMPSVNASLPEGQRLYNAHPDYFLSERRSNVPLLSDVEFTATFVHEGAGYTNALGYYYFDTENPPSSAEEIENFYLIFPNSSFFGAGGGLYSGDKVQLKYYNNGTGEFQNIFPGGITVGWFLVANGWKGSTIGVDDTDRNVYYSFDSFNPEVNDANKKHVVTLTDTERELLLVGFEDLNREVWSDEDFNDAVFYINPTPFEAIDTRAFGDIAPPADYDGDGIINELDDYPKDATKAFDMYYPSETGYNTIAFEDNWPKGGDYDFNDMVIDYQIHYTVSASDQLVTSTMNFILRAIGAGYFNGFGIEFPFESALVESAEGYNLTEPGLITMADNGLEAGHTKAVYIVFDNSFANLSPSEGLFVNTQQQMPYVDPVLLSIETVFKPGIFRSTLGDNYLNPFVFINKDRGAEVHLAGYAPTALADESMFGTEDDTTDGTTKFYIDKNNLPWALEFPTTFDYPIEDKNIVNCYNYFVTWANSGGTLYPDWMENIIGYREESLLYSVPEE